jgi:hypothetical protein
MRRAAVLCAALLVSAAPGSILAGDEAKDAGPSEEGYVTFTKDHPLAKPEAGKALVYVVRPTSMGYAVKSFFLVDDAIAGINRGSSYFYVQVDPGRRVFWSKSENIDALELTVEAGRTYYIQQQVQIGGFRARTKLSVLDEAEGKSALAKCIKHGTLTAKGRAKGAEIVAEHKKDTQEDLDRRAKAGVKSSPNVDTDSRIDVR